MSDYIPLGNFSLDVDLEFEEDNQDFLSKYGIQMSDFEGDFDDVMDTATMTTVSASATATSADSGLGAASLEQNKESSRAEFSSVSNEDIIKFIQGEENKNTMKKTQQDVNKFERFLKSVKGEKRAFETIPSDELDPLLASYILSVKRRDGSEYEPSTVRNLISSLDRILRRQKYPYSIMAEKGTAFQLTRDTLKAKQKSLKKMGKGNKANAAKPLTDAELGIMYEKGVLGGGSPPALLNTIWLNNTMHFGLRGTKENHNLRWGDVTLHRDSAGIEYLELQERQTKTRTGENIQDIRSVSPKMYSNSFIPERDPVAMYKLYAAKRPTDYSKPEDPFYIAPRTVALSDTSNNWFIKLPVGEKKLANFMKTMAANAELDTGKKLTNHSARKTMVQKLRDSGVPPTSIMQISGHKNIQSVINYSEMAQTEQRQCSQILSNPSTCNSVVPQSRTVTETSSSIHHTESHDRVMQSLFAGATLNVQSLHIHMK